MKSRSRIFTAPAQISGDPNEIALLLLHGAVNVVAQVSGNPAIITGFDPSATATQTNAAGGVWQILNPFGSALITSIDFQGADTPVTASGNNSDYSIAQIVATPEPTILGLLGIGLKGLGLAGRRRRGSGRNAQGN